MNDELMVLISSTLDDAGFEYTVKGGPSKRSGYSFKTLTDAIAVMSYVKSPKEYSERMEKVLLIAGFKVTRPFVDKNILRVSKQEGK